MGIFAATQFGIRLYALITSPSWVDNNAIRAGIQAASDHIIAYLPHIASLLS